MCQAEGCADKAAYDKKFGADLWKLDVEQYDKVCVCVCVRVCACVCEQ